MAKKNLILLLILSVALLFAFSCEIHTPTHVVRFMVDGELFREMEVPEGRTVTSLGIYVDKEGIAPEYYWSLNEGGSPYEDPITEDVTLYLVYEYEEYIVQFIDEKNDYKSEWIYVTYGEPIPSSVKPNDPVSPDENYTFVYWTLDPNTGEKFNFTEPITRDTFLYAFYVGDSCTVNLYSNPGKLYQTMEVEFGEFPNLPILSDDENSTFQYWSTAQNGRESVPFTGAMERDIDLYAIWQFDVTIHEGEFTYTNPLFSGEMMTTPLDPIDSDRKFSHWSSVPGGEPFDFSIKHYAPFDLYAVYEDQYTVTFISEGEILLTDVYNKGEFISEIPEVKGDEFKEFLYWSEIEDGDISRKFDFESTAVEKDIVLYAVWNHAATITVTYNNDGDIETEVYVQGSLIDKKYVSNVPDSNGRTFMYWRESGKDYGEFDFNFRVTEDITLVAVYGYYVNIYWEDPNDIARVEYFFVEENKTLPTLSYPETTGYMFKYLSEDFDGSTEYDLSSPVTSSLDLYGIWEKKTYRVTFYNVLPPIGPLYVKYAEPIPAISNPEEDGKRFSHWAFEQNGESIGNINGHVIYEDTSIYAVWDVDVTFVDGEEKTVKTIREGSLVEAPTPKGEGFICWSKSEVTEIPFDFSAEIYSHTTLYAVYEESQT